MADMTYRGNLSAKTIPVDPLLFGRSVIIKGQDQNYAATVVSKTDADKDIGIPQVLYVANCLPTEYGYASMGYYGSKETCPGTPYIAFPVRSATQTATLIHTTEGYLYRLRRDSEGGEVSQFVYIGTYTGNATYALVAGVTYIYFSNNGCYEYNFSTNTLDPITLSGLTPSAIIGITSTGGYMLAWSTDSIAWSSLFDATDFVPSLDTGAGGGGVEGARGAITVCVSNSYGVYIFTAANCVSAQLSTNARYPFNFKEIVGSSGLDSVQEVSFEGNQNSAYGFTSAGFQQISHNGAKNIWTELYENALNTPKWNENSTISGSLVSGVDGKITKAKIVSVASKYICVSIGARDADHYDQCWVYDLALDKWGRFVKDHYEVFEDEHYKIGFITLDKRYIYVDSAFATSEWEIEHDPAYLAAGRYQMSRQRVTGLQEIDLENLYPVTLTDEAGHYVQIDQYPEVFVLPSLDGKSGSFVSTFRNVVVGEAFARYLTRKTAVNHTILIKGHFNLNSILLTLTQGGGR